MFKDGKLLLSSLYFFIGIFYVIIFDKLDLFSLKMGKLLFRTFY